MTEALASTGASHTDCGPAPENSFCGGPCPAIPSHEHPGWNVQSWTAKWQANLFCLFVWTRFSSISNIDYLGYKANILIPPRDILFIYLSVVLGVESMALHMLGNHSPLSFELHPSASFLNLERLTSISRPSRLTLQSSWPSGPGNSDFIVWVRPDDAVNRILMRVAAVLFCVCQICKSVSASPAWFFSRCLIPSEKPKTLLK